MEDSIYCSNCGCIIEEADVDESLCLCQDCEENEMIGMEYGV